MLILRYSLNVQLIEIDDYMVFCLQQESEFTYEVKRELCYTVKYSGVVFCMFSANLGLRMGLIGLNQNLMLD